MSTQVMVTSTVLHLRKILFSPLIEKCKKLSLTLFF